MNNSLHSTMDVNCNSMPCSRCRISSCCHHWCIFLRDSVCCECGRDASNGGPADNSKRQRTLDNDGVDHGSLERTRLLGTETQCSSRTPETVITREPQRNRERDKLSDGEKKRFAEIMIEELRQVPHVITKGVRKTINTIEDIGLVRSEHFHEDWKSLEDNIDSTFAPHSSAKKLVRETAKKMFVALRDTREMRTLERYHRHQKVERSEDGKVYGIEIIYMVRGRGGSDTSDSDVDPSSSSYCREASPEMMIAYRILVKEMEGNSEDLPDKSELAALKF